jgi:Cys-tRNA(Pro)/Cys-tRNA(Cys) deacylase
MRVVCDQNLLALDSIFCGSGRNTRTIEIQMRDLLALTNATVFPITKED